VLDLALLGRYLLHRTGVLRQRQFESLKRRYKTVPDDGAA